MRSLYKQYGRVALAGTDDVDNLKQRDAIGAAPNCRLDNVDHYHDARANRSSALGEIVEATLRAVTDGARRMIWQAKSQQRAYATYRALNALDTRTLRDLGFDRSELMSVAAELSGGAAITRGRSIEHC